MREIQRLQVNPENVRETHKLIITNPDSGQFDIGILTPDTSNPIYLVRINSNGDANHVRNQLNGFWSKYYGCNIQVTLVMQDANGEATTTVGNSVLNTYTITVLRQQKSDTITTTPALKVASGAARVQF